MSVPEYTVDESIERPHPGRVTDGTATPETAYDYLAADYDSAYLTPKDEAENRWLSRYLTGRRYCSGRVLDVGCGTGLLLEICSVDPDGYVGLDVSEKMLDLARAKHPEYRFVKGGMESLGALVDPASFDSAIYMFGSFSYAIDQQAALDSLAHALRPGGQFIIIALGTRYPDRASYSVANAGFEVPIVTYTPADMRALFGGDRRFADIRIRGLSARVDGLNWMGTRLLSAWYRLDAALGVAFPEAGAYVCVEGRLA